MSWNTEGTEAQSEFTESDPSAQNRHGASNGIREREDLNRKAGKIVETGDGGARSGESVSDEVDGFGG